MMLIALHQLVHIDDDPPAFILELRRANMTI